MDYEALLPALASAYIAAFTSHSLGLENFQFRLKYHKFNWYENDHISNHTWNFIGLTGRLFLFIK